MNARPHGSQNPRALPPPTLQSLAASSRSPSEAGQGAARGAPSRPRARRRPRRRDLYRIDLSGRRSAGPGRPPPRLDAVNERDNRPSFLTMVGLVALIVAVVILVFFGIGYLFGRRSCRTAAPARFDHPYHYTRVRHVLCARRFRDQEQHDEPVVELLILFLVVIWLALVYWTYADARRRIADPMLIGCATAASLFPFVGTIVYMIVRPPEYLEDVRERDLEMQAAEAGWRSSATTSARTATTRSRRSSCAAPTACASSRIRARPAASRSIRCGRSVRSASRRSGRHPCSRAVRAAGRLEQPVAGSAASRTHRPRGIAGAAGAPSPSAAQRQPR